MPSFQNTLYSPTRASGVMDTSALRFVGYVHVLTGLVTLSMGVVSAALFVYLGWLCVGIWTGMSFLLCGALSIIAGKSDNMWTVLFVATTNVLTFNFSWMGAVITFSSLFPGTDFYGPNKGGHSIVHNQTTGTALAILYLVVSFIEIVVCLTSIRLAWRILSNFNEGGNLRQTTSYDAPFLSSNSWSEPSPIEFRGRRSSENATPPPDYDAATHTLSTSPKTLSTAGPRPRMYGSIGEAHSDVQHVFPNDMST